MHYMNDDSSGARPLRVLAQVLYSHYHMNYKQCTHRTGEGRLRISCFPTLKLHHIPIPHPPTIVRRLAVLSTCVHFHISTLSLGD